MYTIKQMSDLTGSSTHKLRHYEKMGIISPITDKFTGYRYYTVLDSRRFILACNYVNLGFSLKQSQQLLSKSPPKTLADELSLQASSLEREIILKKLYLERIEEMKSIISTINTDLNKVRRIQLDEIARLEFSNMEIIINQPQILKKREELMEYSPLVEWVSRIPKNELLQTTKEVKYHYGLNIKTHYLKELKISYENLEIIPKGEYLYTVMRKVERTPFERDTLKYLKKYLIYEGIDNFNDAYSSCIYSTIEGDDYVNYHYVILKI